MRTSRDTHFARVLRREVGVTGSKTVGAPTLMSLIGHRHTVS